MGVESSESMFLAKKLVTGSNLPSKEYVSTVGYFGAELKDINGALVWDNTGVMATVDRFGDKILRRGDDHSVADTGRFIKDMIQHGKYGQLVYFVAASDPKRHRGTASEIAQHVKDLGLSDVYSLHQNGIEIKDRELFETGIALQDIFRAQEIGNDKLKKIDRYQALAVAAEYIRYLHDSRGVGVGEILPSDIIFRKATLDEKTGQYVVSEPVLNVPDIVFRKDGNVLSSEQKAIDVIDMIFSHIIEELETNDKATLIDVGKITMTILGNYQDIKVIETVKSLLGRGRLTLIDPNLKSAFDAMMNKVFYLHNAARLRVPEDLGGHLRKAVMDYCDSFGAGNKQEG